MQDVVEQDVVGIALIRNAGLGRLVVTAIVTNQGGHGDVECWRAVDIHFFFVKLWHRSSAAAAG